MCYKLYAANTPFDIKVLCCCVPKEERLLRKLDTNFVKGLKARMRADPVAPGIPPLALHCIDVSKKEDFLEHLAGQYAYEVLGGMHTVVARKELLEEVPGIYCQYTVTIHTHMYVCMIKILVPDETLSA